MPIVYLHGAAIRDHNIAPTIATMLSEHVVQVLASQSRGESQNDRIYSAYWGGHAVGFAWGHASLPRDSEEKRSGEDPFLALARRHLQESGAQAATDATGSPTTLSSNQLSAVLMAALQDLKFEDASSQTGDAPALLSTKLFMRWRPAINAVLTQFFGDIFVYLARRGDADAPGQIVTDFLDVLLRAATTWPAEPMVVLSHSMGGQIVYDCVTYYMPRIEKYAKLKIDFWASTGSQVSLFEEMKLFRASDPALHAPDKVRVSNAHLGYWYNVWDPNDLLSYTAAPVFNDVDDEKFESNLPMHTAHFGYLVSAAFYSRFAEKVRSALLPFDAANA